MGCLKLTYHNESEPLGAFRKNLRVVKGNRALRKKTGLNYYPFGMMMPGRNYSSDSYRYGFNCMEKDDEVKGSGNSINYKARIYDPRLGKFFSIDPLTDQFPFYSPYQFAGNKPIWAIDLDGKEEFFKTDYINLATGQIYKTQIQVINALDGGDDANGIAPQQIIHNTTVTVDGAGNAIVAYTGTSQGTRVAAGSASNVSNIAPGSDLFTLQENLKLADSQVTGERSTSGGIVTKTTSVGSDGVYAHFSDSNGGAVGRDNQNKKNEISDYGVVTVNYGGAPANEPILPSGFNATPLIGQRFVDPASPIQNINNVFLNWRGSVNTSNNNLAAPRSQQTTQAEPPGTTKTVPSTNGGTSVVTF